MKNALLPSVSSQLFSYAGNGIEQVISIPAHADNLIYQNTYGSNKSSLGTDPNAEYKSHFYEEQLIDGSSYNPFQSSTTNVYQLQQPAGPSSSSMTGNRQDQPYSSGAGGCQISNSSSVDDNNIPHQQQQLLSFCNKISHSTVSNNYNIRTYADTRKRPIISKRGLCNGDNKEGGRMTKKQKRDLLYPEIEQCLLDDVHQANKQQVVKKTIQTQGKPVPVRRQSNKLSDKITALQKLVSPYGKTDTASVLQEASISIMFLQHQIETMLRKMSASSCSQREVHDLQKCAEKKVDLHDKGFCLVPVSLTQTFIEEEEIRKR